MSKSKSSCSLPQLTTVILSILITLSAVYCGFNFDRIMERPAEAQDMGRYVVTDDKLQAMQYIRNISHNQKRVILSDSHMGNIAQGAIDLDFEKAELFNLNSGGALYSYFNRMRHDPNITTMYELMDKTNSQIGFFVIGLDDWRGWQPESAYWISSDAIENLKATAVQWEVFGEKTNLYVFVFQKT